MYFENLKIYQFRNLQKQEIKFSKGTNIFVGANGQGKSNFIESLIYLVSGKSFRPFKKEHFINWQTVDKLVYVCANIEKDSLLNKYELKLDGRSQILKNEKTYTWSKLQKEIPYVLFSPESLNAIKQGSAERRALLDSSFCLMDKNAYEVLQNFQKTLRTRNKVLSDFKNNKQNLEQTNLLLSSLNKAYISLCLSIMRYRLDYILQHQRIFQSTAKEIFGDSSVEIDVDYVASGQRMNDWSDERIEQYLVDRLSSLASAELAAGVSLVGPQKHDIYFLYNKHDSRYYCSQGQQRTLILSFKIAKIVYYKKTFDQWPFLFLDDVLSELDADKRNHLISFLKDSEGQAFITTTDISFSEELLGIGSKVFEVNEGLVKPLQEEVV